METPTTLVVHADWSCSPKKRWMARARRAADGLWRAEAPEQVGDLATFLRRLREDVEPSAAVLVGFDFPIGVPLAYGERAGIEAFGALLPRLGEGEWSSFYEVAGTREEISVHRPFYPQRPGGTRQGHLTDRLGVTHMDALRRRCEQAHDGRRSACPLFWTLGGQQVGKAAICGWREMLAPALRRGDLDLSLWPFDGPLHALLKAGRIVVAETYPAEFYAHLGVSFRPGERGWGKRSERGRKGATKPMLAWAERSGVSLARTLAQEIECGFGSGGDGEDRFDAVIGLFGMLNVLLGYRATGEPADPRITSVEGWILGQTHTP